MASNMVLYWGSGSIPCWKPMIVLEEKGLSGYDSKLLSFSEKQHKGEEVMKLNPRGQLPTFKDGEVVVNESGAICFYLENKYSSQGTKLLPDDSAEKAKVLQRVFEAGNIETIFLKELVYYLMMTKEDQIDQALVDTRMKAAGEELKKWDEYIKAAGGFVAGSSFSMADVFFFPYVAFGVRLGLKFVKYPSIGTYYNKLMERPSVKATMPPHWKDGPGKQILENL